MKLIIAVFIILLGTSCEEKVLQETASNKPISQKDTLAGKTQIDQVFLVVLGTIQDAGSPQIGCKKDCCKELFAKPDPLRKVVSLGVIDQKHQKKFMFDATPDFVAQWEELNHIADFDKERVDGIFLTHAHIGHYTGLMYLGKESMNASKIPVYAMPGMKSFLEKNGPWSQLVKMHNIHIEELEIEKVVQATANLKVTPFLVPHRDEYSETVGYRIDGPNKSALFIPDINKWNVWEKDIADEIKKVDYAFIDASFFDGNELGNRNMAEIPHPFVVESLELLKGLSAEDRIKVYFIHFNHTNPLLNPESKEALRVNKEGFNIAHIWDVFIL